MARLRRGIILTQCMGKKKECGKCRAIKVGKECNVVCVAWKRGTRQEKKEEKEEKKMID